MMSVDAEHFRNTESFHQLMILIQNVAFSQEEL